MKIRILKNAGKVAVIWILSTMLSVVLNGMSVRTENLLLIYVLGVMICSLETGSMCWSIGSAVIFSFTFNFLFTAPKYTFRMEDPNYMISLGIFIIVAFIAASLTVKLQRQTDIANVRAERMVKLNDIGSGFLNVSGIPALEKYSREQISGLTGKMVDIRIREEDGAVVFNCLDGELEREEQAYVDMVIAQITIVLQREQMSVEKEEARIQIEKERLKSTLLRSISHDLRTPLTGIAGSASFLNENYDMVDRESALDMLAGICSDAEWLNSMVENLLNMTRIQEGRLDLHQKMEVVDDLFSNAASLVGKRLGNHSLEMNMPSEIILVSVDGHLFTQVLVNLIDNAVRHSGDGTEITLSVKTGINRITFLVEDNGVGILEEKMDQLFDSFFTTAYENGDRQRGIGLGLSICRAIVEAHGGRIFAYNNKKGGASFQIDMPMNTSAERPAEDSEGREKT